MAIDYTGTSAGLFVRLGKIINAGVEERAAQSTLVTHLEEVVGKYTATSIDRTEYLGSMAGDKEAIADAAGRSAQETVRDALERTIIEQVDAEAPTRLVAPTLPNALRVLATDMGTTQSIGTTNLSIGSLSVTAAETTPAAQGALLMSTAPRYSYAGTKSATKPAATDSILAEIVTARCTKDARDGSLIRGNERFSVTGEDAVDRLDRRWPRGSGAVLALNSTCGAVESSRVAGQNMLLNSGFERLNGTPFPLDWIVAAGTEGTNINNNKNAYRGENSLEFVGTTGVKHAIYQTMGRGPLPSIKSNTVYFVSIRARAATGTITAGDLKMGLRDGANAEISGCNVLSSLAGLTTTYTLFTGSFTTPLNLPSEIRASLYFGTVNLTNAQSVYVDEYVLCEAAYLYTGGPGCCVIAGSTDHELDDRMSRTITKTASQWQQELDRYLNLAALDVQFPTSASPTISTTLIA